LVLEYVKGKSLEKLLEEKGKLDVLEACKIAFDVARALEYAHSKHILHCDLKPSNILIDESLGEAKVTDFGLAKGLSSGGIKGGTLDYLPPEAPQDYTEKSDIYQLGLIFYEMIAGGLPDKKNPKPLGFEKLDYLIERCLSENPGERPSAREFREVIYEFVKEKYGMSLKLSGESDTTAKYLLELAIYDVKSDELATAMARKGRAN
jgi:serine/threonine protein kinase